MGRLAIVAIVLCAVFGQQGSMPAPARACGGLFCGARPVDQSAERIVFRVDDDSLTMVVQIRYSGAAEDFAWVLPMGTLPDEESLAVFPQRALSALDARTAILFQAPGSCSTGLDVVSLGGAGTTQVAVAFRAEVGPYDVAGIESEDPSALYQWLRDNGFNVGPTMLPYIELYTREGMKFLALKLRRDQDAQAIEPFRFEFSGTVPSIPLRMTALAAEPEMGLVVTIFGEQRYAGANWPALEIPSDQIAWSPMQVAFPSGGYRSVTSLPVTNWPALVARAVDAAGGQGWVTEAAETTESLVAQIESVSSNSSAPEDIEAAKALRDLIGDAPYMTRLYTRLSPEEMWSDPVFRPDVVGGAVRRWRMLSAEVLGEDRCPREVASGAPASIDPCLFVSCGAGGICRPVEPEDLDRPVAGCGCLDGATARTTVEASPLYTEFEVLSSAGAAAPGPTVVCQDARLSFLNPGDEGADGQPLGDPCEQFDCGPNGTCMAVNMTPTCACDHGFVAVGSFAEDGARVTRCERPMVPVPDEFYQQRLPDLPSEMPPGRPMDDVDMELPVIEPSMDDLGSDGMPLPRVPEEPGSRAGGASSPATSPPMATDEGPQEAMEAMGGGGCTASAQERKGATWRLVLATIVLLATGLSRVRKRARRGTIRVASVPGE